MPRDDEKRVSCSFCYKTQDQVEKLIAGPNVYICNECIKLCMGVLDDGYLDDDELDTDLPVPDAIPTPREIHAVLDQYIIGQEQAKKAEAIRSLDVAPT